MEIRCSRYLGLTLRIFLDTLEPPLAVSLLLTTPLLEKPQCVMLMPFNHDIEVCKLGCQVRCFDGQGIPKPCSPLLRMKYHCTYSHRQYIICDRSRWFRFKMTTQQFSSVDLGMLQSALLIWEHYSSFLLCSELVKPSKLTLLFFEDSWTFINYPWLTKSSSPRSTHSGLVKLKKRLSSFRQWSPLAKDTLISNLEFISSNGS